MKRYLYRLAVVILLTPATYVLSFAEVDSMCGLDVAAHSVSRRAGSDIGTALPGLFRCSLAWGDYDNDGDLDLVLAGNTSSNRITRIYRNDGGVLTDSGVYLPGVDYCSVAWGDYDKDGDLDLVLAGDTGTSDITQLYRNDGGAFADSGVSFPGVSSCSLAWGDFDNDGNPDLALAGECNGSRITRIYRNLGGGVFVDSGIALTGVGSCSLAWGDYDNDGDLDLVLAGECDGGRITRVYRNQGGGVFMDSGSVLPGAGYCSLAWGDYDNDGDLDLAVTGWASGDGITCIYRNDGGGVFKDIKAVLPETGYWDSGSLAWGDYDNDGDLDLAVAGDGYSGAVTRIYRNDKGVFIDSGIPLTGALGCSLAWGDCDNDGDLDLAVTGATTNLVRIAQIFRNSAGDSNTVPTPPTDLRSCVTNGNDVIFRWAAASDSETPAQGLSYNLFVGTSPGVADLFVPQAQLSNGSRRTAALGNTQKRCEWTLHGLPCHAPLYWGVQSVDTAYAGSLFATNTTAGSVPSRIHWFPLDTDPGWSRQGEWGFGKPAGQGGSGHGWPDPSSGATGSNVFGANLNGDYSTAEGGPFYLMAGPFSLRGVTNVILRFQRWLNTDSRPYAYVTLEGSSNGVTWIRIWNNDTNAITDATWTQCQYDIAGFADNCPGVYVRWGYQIWPGAAAYCGWNIDDVEFLGSGLPLSSAPASVGLCPSSDAGLSSADGLTGLDNSSSTTTLQFRATGTTSGATVTVYADDISIGSSVAGGDTTTVTTDGIHDLADGTHAISARQTERGKAESADSPTVSITIDTVHPPPGGVSGGLDPFFGVSGKMTVAFAGMANGISDVATQSDGKIVAIGNGAEALLARLNPDGSLDSTFDGDGRLFSAVSMASAAVAVQSDGKIVMGGYFSNGHDLDFVVARLTPSGLRDTTFGQGTGRVLTPVGSGDDYLRDLVVQTDGKILAGGYTANSAIVRYNTDGTLDANFGDNGMAARPTNDCRNVEVYSLLVQPDGRILAGGYSVPGGTQAMTVVRLNTNGTVDTSFGSGGTGIVYAAKGEVRKLVLEPGGEIVAAGNTYAGGHCEITVVRLTANGSLDPLFGRDGVVTTSFGAQSTFVRDVVVLPDGKILVAGNVDPGSNSDFVLLRYNSDGRLDLSFDGDGSARTDFAGHDYAFGVVVQHDKALLVGRNVGFSGIIMARYLMAATVPDLQADSDTGISPNDNVTADSTPTFELSDTGGFYWRLYRDSTLVSRADVLGDDGGIYKGPGVGTETLSAQPGGTHAYTFTLVDAAGNESAHSAPLSITIDTVPPAVLSVVPASGSVLVSSHVAVDVTFAEPVTGVEASDLAFAGAAGADANVGSPTNVIGTTWRFPVSGLVNGALQLSLALPSGKIQDIAGNGLSPAVWSYTMIVTAPLGTPVAWLRSHGFTNDDLTAAETNDADHDGMLNWQEYLADTNPTNGSSCLEITGLQPTPSGLQINWKGGTGVWQYLESRQDLTSTVEQWRAIFSNPPPTALATNILRTDETNGSLHYRIKAMR